MLDTMAATKVTEDVVDTQIIEDAVRLACRAPSLTTVNRGWQRLAE
jgi:hypothetical protein